ncbi:hypothetical protein ACVIN2_002992 [Bradyrhizobium sp. USDA 3650]
MDVYASPRQRHGHIVREHLHIAGEHDGFSACDLYELQDLRLLLRLGFPRNREVMKNDPIEIKVPIGLARMGNNHGNLYGDFTDPPSIQQVGEAMVEFGDQ